MLSMDTQMRYAAQEAAIVARSDDKERQVLSGALGLILKYANALVADPPELEIRDERELPAPKESLVNCFRLVLMHETRPHWREAFYNSALKLAYFWPNVGPERLTLPANLFNRDGSPGIIPQDLTQERIQKFSEAFAKVGPETDRIGALLDESIMALQGLTDLA